MSQGFLVLAQLGGGGFGGSSIIFMVLIFAIMWVVLIMPQQRQMKQHRTLLDTLKKGDEVLTQGGLIGRIASMDEKVITLEIASGVKIRVLKTSVQQLWGADAAAKTDEKKEEKK